MLPGIPRQVSVAAALLLLLGCGLDDASPASETVELTSLQLYENNDALNGVRDLALSSDGGVWVITETDPSIHRYSADGGLVASFGRSGNGPGELRYPQGLFPEEGVVRVWDQGSRSIVDFTHQGAYTGNYRTLELGSSSAMAGLDRTSYAQGRLLRKWSAGYLLQEPTRMISDARGVADAVLLVLDAGGVIVDTLVDFRSMSAAATEILGSAQHFVPIPLWTTCPSNRAAVLNPYSNVVQWYEYPGGVASEVDTLEADTRPLLDSEIGKWVEHAISIETREQNVELDPAEVAQLIDRMITARRADFGTIAPSTVRLLCDEQDRLWFQGFDTQYDPRGFGREWSVHANGNQVMRYRFPEGFQPMAIRAGVVYGIARDDLDVERAAIVRTDR